MIQTFKEFFYSGDIERLIENQIKYTYNDVIVKFNTKDKKDFESHVHRRLKERSKLTMTEFKTKFNKVVDIIIHEYKLESGEYLVVFKKSNIKVLFDFSYNGFETFVFTVLGVDMSVIGGKTIITLDECVDFMFNEYDVNISNNEYILIDGYGFMIENNVKKVEGLRIIEINNE